jgi:hypothetical protein
MNAPKDRKPYLLWINYGTDGWSLSETFDTPEDALEHVRSGGSYGEEFLITKEVKFKETEDGK